MKSILLLFIGLTAFEYVSSQNKCLTYHSACKNEYSLDDTLKIEVSNKCELKKYVVFSLEFLDSTGEWQLEDFDFLVEPIKGMTIVELKPMVSRIFDFKIGEIDPVFFAENKKVKFRILCNLYSKDKVQIIKTQVIKEFLAFKKVI